jgi:hypothetical protein
LNIKDFTRDAVKVQAALTELSGGAIVTKGGVKIYIPTRYRDKSLATIGNETYILGLFMMTVDDKYYAVSSVNALMKIEPSSVNLVVMDDKDYFEFEFEAGDTVFPTTDLVKSDKLLYYIFDEIVARGNVPIFMNYTDLGNLFESAQKHAGKQLSSTPTILHMLLSVIARDSKDLTRYFRQVTNGKDLDTVEFLQLRSSTHGATNTTAKLMGSHFSDNLTSALVNPSDREENIERILRM